MELKFYYLQSDDLIAEIPSNDVPIIGQKIFLPDQDELYVVLDTVIDYRKWGNNYPTYANITVIRARTSLGRV